MNCSESQISRDKSLFYNQHDSSLGVASRKSLEIQTKSITKPKTHSEREFV